MPKFAPPFDDSFTPPTADKLKLGQQLGVPDWAVPGLFLSKCSSCETVAVWNHATLVYPGESMAPPPSTDLPEECERDYREAAEIVNVSPRGAAALLRLVIEKLCTHLGATSGDINKDIGYLVAEKGLPDMIRKALDAVRVIGNKSVHPGNLNMEDDVDTALGLFRAVNVIVHATITQPKEIEALYGKLPESARAAADKRDGRGQAK